MKSIVLKPVTGTLDLRSAPEDVDSGLWRYALNVNVPQKGKLCRMPGWVKLMDKDDGYNNQDFRDQLLTITGKTRKPITFLFEGESTLKTTMLLVGTEDCLFQLNTGTGNYRVLSASIGGFKRAAQNRDTIVMTNDHDKPQHWVFDTSPSVAPIPDMETLGITKVGVVITFRGVTFYMNIVQNGRTFSNRILWSDIDNPLSIIPATESIAGDLDLDSGDSILAALPLGNILLVYTTRGIWQLSLVGGDEVFAASKRYDSNISNEGALAYPNTLISTGDAHVFAGQSGIYEYSLFDAKPKRIEWVHKATSAMFDVIDKDACDIGAAAGYDADRHEIWLSWKAKGADLPTQSLCINTQNPFVSLVDHGFTAFCQFMPRTSSAGVLRDWLKNTCVCTAAQLEEFFGTTDNEGGICDEPTSTVDCSTQPDSFFTNVSITLDDGIVMEDFNQADPTDNSLCSRLNGVSLADQCVVQSQSDQCNAARLFVMASAQDFCLKQSSDSYYREVCTGFGVCGTYTNSGYKSVLRSGPLAFKNFDDEKLVSNFIAEASAVAASVPGQLTLRIGASRQALDPNEDCGIIWEKQASRQLECQGGRTEAQHLAHNTRPDGLFEWPMYWVGMYLYFELTIDNKNSTPKDVGAAVCLSKFIMEVDTQKVRW